MTKQEWASFREALHDPVSRMWLDELVEENLYRREFGAILSESEKQAAYENVMAKIRQHPVRARQTDRIHFMRRWWAAAMLLVLISGGAYLWLSVRQPADPAATVQHARDIHPGRSGALLTLADGSQVSLDSVRNGVIALQSGVKAKVANGELLYEGDGEQVMYNMLSTTNGRQFQVTLPDGTRAWLNSASSIRYPTVFEGTTRKITITGEVYLEVAKNAHQPFLVNVDGKATVEVLGTHLNINAYSNEHFIKTTLFEGSVKVGRPDNEPVLLKPGQQASMAMHKEAQAPGIAVRSLDAPAQESVLAWKNGFFFLTGATLKEIMRQVERWYDIEVVYENEVPDVEFIGEMPRDVSLEDFLVALERSDIHYRLEGRKLIIMR